jgi:myo-inositol-1(or 4)-monophosphatase
MEDLKILTESVCCIAREAGYFLKEERKNFSREAIRKKQPHDYVSYVDKESEKRVVAALRELLPEAGFIAEEGSAVYHDEPYCWVVDPLDGTTNYIHDNAPYCVRSLCATRILCCWELFMTLAGMNVFMPGREVALM